MGAGMSSTTEHIADGVIEKMTAAQARYHLRRARERIASLVAALDDARADASCWRTRAKDAEVALDRVRRLVNGTDV
jgi:hypothetical protein